MDKAYDANATLSLLEARDIAAAIPSRAKRKAPRWHDPGVYGMRHFVANRFAAIPSMSFGGIAAGYCQRALLYGGMLNLASTLVAFREAVSRPYCGRSSRSQSATGAVMSHSARCQHTPRASVMPAPAMSAPGGILKVTTATVAVTAPYPAPDIAAAIARALAAVRDRPSQCWTPTVPLKNTPAWPRPCH